MDRRGLCGTTQIQARTRGAGDPTFEELAQVTPPDAAERVVPPLFGAASGGSCASPEAAKSISLPAPGWTHMICWSSSRLAILRLQPRRCHRCAGRCPAHGCATSMRPSSGRWSVMPVARKVWLRAADERNGQHVGRSGSTVAGMRSLMARSERRFLLTFECG